MWYTSVDFNNEKRREMTMNGTTCFLAELVGTAILILLGNGVVANVKLEKSGMKDGGTV